MISSLPDSDFMSGHISPKNALHSSDGESVNQVQSEKTRYPSGFKNFFQYRRAWGSPMINADPSDQMISNEPSSNGRSSIDA
jgi:hypothetical protein